MWDWLGPEKDENGEVDQSTGHRCAKCGKVPIEKESEIELLLKGTGGSDVRGMMNCASVWACPVCAYKKARNVGAEIATCVYEHLHKDIIFTDTDGTQTRLVDRARDVWMLTLTIPHYQGQPQQVVIDALQSAWKAFSRSKRWRKFSKRWGLVGVLRVFDETFGANGVHPHWHIGLFPENAVFGFEFLRANEELRKEVLKEAAAELFEAWEKAVEATGQLLPEKRAAFRERGLHIDGGDQAAQYLTKWGLSEELGMGALKSNNRFALLDDPKSKAVFVEFYEASKGLSIVTGLGSLKKKLGVTDEVVAEHLERLQDAREEFEAEAEDGEPMPDIPIKIARHFLREIAYVGWGAIQSVALNAVGKGLDPQSVVNDFLWEVKKERARKGRRVKLE